MREKKNTPDYTLTKRDVVTLVVVVVCVGIYQVSEAERTPIASSETRFVERGISGLQIVPASCPSSPHSLDECNKKDIVGTPDNPSLPVTSVTPVTPVDPLNPAQPNNPAAVQCSATYFCSGNDLYYRGTQCTEAFQGSCVFGCSGGACLPVPQGNLSITASPSLIRSGNTTTVSWTTVNMRANSCTVRENNPDITNEWTGNSGSQATGQIRLETTYTLTCTNLQDQVVSDTAKVNIIPIFEEL